MSKLFRLHKITPAKVTVALVSAVLASGALADDRGKHRVDHEVARQALLRGEIMPLEAVLVEVRRTIAGEFVGVELEHKQGAWVYTVKLLTPDGRLLRIRADARTGRTLEQRVGKH